MNRTRDILFICCFLLMLAIPYTLKVLDIRTDTGNSEKRKLIAAPRFNFERTVHASGPVHIFREFIEDISTYKQQYDEYYTDNFRLKNNLFDLYVATKHGVLRSSPIPANVMEGKDNWFFLGNSYCNVMLEYTALDVFKKEQVDSITQYLTERAQWMKARGIDFYVAVAPDKQNIYGEYLPLTQRPVPSKFEQIKHAHNNAYNLIDLAPELLKHKDIRLFHKTDTHWNEYGAFWGFHKLMERLSNDHPGITGPLITDFTIDTVVAGPMDLAVMLRLNLKEHQIVLKYNGPEQAVKAGSILPVPEVYNTNPGSYEVRYVNPKRKLKILVFRDSFSNAWVKFFKEYFGESVFIADYNIDKKVIEQEKPDIVVYEIVQRDIDALMLPGG